MSPMDRRTFLSGLAAAGASSTLPRFGFASSECTGTGRNVILVFVKGGWDSTFSLDARDPSDLIDPPTGQVATAGNLTYFNANSTQNAVKNFFDAHYDVTAVVKGIQVSSISHTGCTNKIFTGTSSAKRPDFGVLTAAHHGACMPIPYLAIAPDVFSGPYGAYVGRMGPVGQLRGLIRKEERWMPIAGSSFADTEFIDMEMQDEALVRDFLTARAQRFQATRGQVGYNQKRVDDFIASVQRRYDLNDFKDNLPDRQPGESLNFPLADQLELAETAIIEGLSYAAVVRTDYGFDTHDGNDNQGALQKSLFEELTAFISRMKTPYSGSTCLLDHTTVVVMSEMTRTPKKNGEGGKDHWPVACALVIGAGVAGNQMYGHTSERMEGMAVNYQDGSLTGSDLQYVKTENFAAGLLDLMNVPIPDHLTGTPFAPFKAS